MNVAISLFLTSNITSCKESYSVFAFVAAITSSAGTTPPKFPTDLPKIFLFFQS